MSGDKLRKQIKALRGARKPKAILVGPPRRHRHEGRQRAENRGQRHLGQRTRPVLDRSEAQQEPEEDTKRFVSVLLPIRFASAQATTHNPARYASSGCRFWELKDLNRSHLAAVTGSGFCGARICFLGEFGRY